MAGVRPPAGFAEARLEIHTVPAGERHGRIYMARYPNPLGYGKSKSRFSDPRRRVEANRFGIPESIAAELLEATSLDVVLLPVVAFDRLGHRLGTGGGYYDRTFAFRQGSSSPPLLIGIAYAFQEVDAIEVAAWDVDLDWVVTEREAIECVKRRA